MRTKRNDYYAPIHPGEHLRDFIEEYGLTQYGLAKALGVPQPRICKIANEQAAITADTALRLGRYFNNSAEFWMNLQGHYELRLARHERGEEIEAKVKPLAAAVENTTSEIPMEAAPVTTVAEPARRYRNQEAKGDNARARSPRKTMTGQALSPKSRKTAKKARTTRKK